MAKHKLEIEPDYNFLLIGISSHEKDYSLCWAINKKLNIELIKKDSLEIKGRKQTTSAYFSFFEYINEEVFIEYFVIANVSENKLPVSVDNTLFTKEAQSKSKTSNELLIPEQKQMNYFVIIKGELAAGETDELIKQIKQIDAVQTAIKIDVTQLRSKQNLIF